ncbi:DUF6266 family protein [Pedobacter psychroterrae]|uniref:Uncharacterized protein n=1 Tax=Pedobacter psychroterrae TaxID=2530453 RepID=A0A4R0ND14_9SPHI|nr:DUF6266 family protein [Pedobacter psychroterrae]TCC98138.1 hypothetical protein EZ437_18245 [Pedobacter psychroterrae]
MAILKGGILGGFTGKIGDVIGYIRFGKSYIKMKSKKKKKKASDKQVEARKRMSVAVKFINTAKTFVAIGFAQSGARKRRTAYADAVSHQILYGLKGEYPAVSIDFEKVMLAKGNMPGVQQAEIVPMANGVTFNWEPELMASIYHIQSRAMLFVYCEDLGKSFYNLNAARIMDKTDFMELPLNFKGHKLQAYIAFASDDRKKISDSRYIGYVDY